MTTTLTLEPVLKQTGEECVYCTFAQEHKWWGPQLQKDGFKSHCKTCHRSWTSENETHCTLCHEHFANHRVSDAHYSEEGCKHPETDLKQNDKARFAPKEGKDGITWRFAFHGTKPEFVK